jgi:hypothetical protein
MARRPLSLGPGYQLLKKARLNPYKKEGDLIRDLRYSFLLTSNGKGKRHV